MEGMDWVKGKSGIYWDKDAKSQFTTKAGETYLGFQWSDVQAYQASTSTDHEPDGPKLSPGTASTSEETAGRAAAYQQSQQVVDYQDISQPTTSLAIGKNVVYTYAVEATIAKATTLVRGILSGSKGASKGALDGSFSVSDWSGYPAGGLGPSGPLRLLEGGEYTTARSLANTTNAAMRRANPGALKGFQIHEIQPVKYGGSPTDISNKILLSPAEHAQYINFWNSMMKNLRQ